MTISIDLERLEKLPPLKSGSHENGEDMCVMEAVAWIAGEPWSDHPQCVCPVLAAFMRSFNDGLSSDAERDRLLKPLIPRLVNTRGSKALEQRRATMAADWLVRTHTVAWLRLAKLNASADALASLPEITDFANCPPLKPALDAACKDAAAAWTAARAAAVAAARDAAFDAAEAAAWYAAEAAAWYAARAAAAAAAWYAARAAARDALRPTRDALQVSALALIERMIATTEPA